MIQVSKLTEDEKEQLQGAIKELTIEGYRVLGVGEAAKRQ